MKKLSVLGRSKLIISAIAIVSIILMANACYYDDEETLYPDGGCTTAGVTYNGFVRPFINANCSCHLNGSADGGVILQSYLTVRIYIDNGKLIKSVKHEAGAIAMPPGVPKKGSCEISKLEAWITAGALEN